MKKISILILAVIFVLSTLCVSADEAITEEKAAEVLMTYGIIHGDPDGNLRLNDTITRAEFTKIITAVASLGSSDKEPVFQDISKTHWARGYISAAYQNGIIAGISESAFEPDSPVTNEQAVKMIVCALGYGIQADRIGGFPFAHMKIADNIGVLNDININGSMPASRGTVMKMVYNSLEIPHMQEVEDEHHQQIILIMDGSGEIPLITFKTKLEQ